jgi:hypothetical protein
MTHVSAKSDIESKLRYSKAIAKKSSLSGGHYNQTDTYPASAGGLTSPSLLTAQESSPSGHILAFKVIQNTKIGILFVRTVTVPPESTSQSQSKSYPSVAVPRTQSQS